MFFSEEKKQRLLQFQVFVLPGRSATASGERILPPQRASVASGWPKFAPGSGGRLAPQPYVTYHQADKRDGLLLLFSRKEGLSLLPCVTRASAMAASKTGQHHDAVARMAWPDRIFRVGAGSGNG
jgi:hypothetical protein